MVVRKSAIQYDNRIILMNISIEIKKGSSYAIIGENGAGKTEMLKLIYSKHLLNEKSEFKTFEFSYADFRPKNTSMTTYEYFEVMLADKLGPKWFDISLKEVKKWGYKLEIFQKGLVQLSGGELRALNIIIKLIVKPDLLIVDEPESNIDKDKVNILLSELKKYSKGGTLIISSHNPDIINKLSKNIFLVKGKKISQIKHKRLTGESLSNLISNRVEVIDENYEF